MKCQRPGQLLGRRQRRLKRARGPWPPPLSPSLLPQEAARRRLLRAGGSPGERSLGEAPAPAEGTGPRIQNCRCSYPTTATLYVPSTTLPIHTPSLPPPPPPPLPRPLRSPSLDWSRDKSNGKRRAGTLPADPGRDRPGPEAFPSLARAPNPPLPPRAPLPDFRNFAKNSPHEFSCPADPRWRRIHRGGCWEQDLYPLTSAVTPAVPTSLQAAAAEEGSGDCGPDRVGGWVVCFSRVGEGTRRGPSPPRFPPRGPHLLSHRLTGRLVATLQPLQRVGALLPQAPLGCFARATGPRSGEDRGVQGRGMVRWRRSALPGDSERVCVCVQPFVRPSPTPVVCLVPAFPPSAP